MAMLRKVNSHSVDICKLIKKINNVKEDPGRKIDLNFDFSQNLIFMMFQQEGMLCSAYDKTLLTSKETGIGR